MATSRPAVTAALASLEARWGAAAPRRLGDVVGSLATVPLPDEAAPFGAPPYAAPSRSPGSPGRAPRPDDGRIVPTGFAALDAILGPGGLPRDAAVVVRGDGTSGKTTLALRLTAEAQAAGSIVAYLDLARSLDPVEAVARGVRLEWLVVLAPETVDEGLAMAGALVQARAVDLLVVDLPDVAPDHGSADGLRSVGARSPATPDSGSADGGMAPRSPAARSQAVRSPSVGDRLQRLGALTRRAGTMLVVLEPPSLPSALHRSVDGSTGLRLELARRSWIRLGRDVVGQWTEAVVARSRLGPPGRRAELRILYADGGDRDACLRRDELLARPLSVTVSPDVSRTHHDAYPPSPLVPSPAPARPEPPRLRLVPGGSRRAGGSPLGRRPRPRHESGGARTGRPPRDAPRERPSARA